MHGAYIGALETRLGWLDWSYSEAAQKLFGRDRIHKAAPGQSPLVMGRHVLLYGDTYYMDRRFCGLVDHAREDLPDDMAYDPQWLLSPDGWLWMGEPVRVPDLLLTDRELTPEFTAVRAVGWRTIPEGTVVQRGLTPDTSYVAPASTTHFLFFIAFGDYRAVAEGRQPMDGVAVTAQMGFGIWSYFTLRPGDTAGERIARFEREMRMRDPSGSYVDEPGRRMSQLHEIRWLFAALKLMSQRLATRVRVPTARHVRRRAERAGRKVPPYVDVVTLRRLHHEAIRTGQDRTAEPVDWQWQWIVRGHWRNQWYPAESAHKPKFIESYVKGPEDRPLKPKGMELFVARR